MHNEKWFQVSLDEPNKIAQPPNSTFFYGFIINTLYIQYKKKIVSFSPIIPFKTYLADLQQSDRAAVPSQAFDQVADTSPDCTGVEPEGVVA